MNPKDPGILRGTLPVQALACWQFGALYPKKVMEMDSPLTSGAQPSFQHPETPVMDLFIQHDLAHPLPLPQQLWPLPRLHAEADTWVQRGGL